MAPPIGGISKRSRNTTPVSTASTEQSQTLPVSIPSSASSMTYSEILDRFSRGSSPPPSGTIKKIGAALKSYSDAARIRSEHCDRGMRDISKKKKRVIEQAREQEMADREAEESRKERIRQQSKLKKERDVDERPLAVGAHSLARQDGTNTEVVADAEFNSPKPGEDTEMPDVPAMESAKDSPSSEDSHQPPPASAIPQFQTFGADPSTYDDPTIYHLRDILPDMDEQEKKDILGVAVYPHDDLHDLTPGTPPDRDFTNAKPQHQVSATAFATYLEPFVRDITEEDLAFLRERGDRVGPFVVPRRGTKTYQEIWAEEDGVFFAESEQAIQERATLNQPSGSIEDMTDEVAETSEVSIGPLASRFLSLLIPERRAPVVEQTNGDTSMTNNDDAGHEAENSSKLPPATALPENVPPGSRTATNKLDYAQMDERLKQELRHLGFLAEDAEPDYDSHFDDEVAARLRYLQGELERVSVLNGARKARVLELAEESMARQEYSTIADDLDTQLNQAYLKRHRNVGKGKKHNVKKPGVAVPSAALGNMRPGLGEPIRLLMERRDRWKSWIGPVVGYGRTSIPEQTIFDKAIMAKLETKEKDSWVETQEQQ